MSAEEGDQNPAAAESAPAEASPEAPPEEAPSEQKSEEPEALGVADAVEGAPPEETPAEEGNSEEVLGVAENFQQEPDEEQPQDNQGEIYVAQVKNAKQAHRTVEPLAAPTPLGPKDYLDFVIRDNTVRRVPKDKLEEVLKLCQKEKIDAIEGERYQRAKSLTQAEKVLEAASPSKLPALMTPKSNNSVSRTTKSYNQKEFDDEEEDLCDADLTTEQRIAKVNRKIQDFDSHTTESFDQLREKHNQEFQEFESQYTDDEKFNALVSRIWKPSPNVVYLKNQCRVLAYNGDFDSAEKEKKRLDKLIRTEKAQAQKRLNDSFQDQKKKLLRKQEEEIQQLEQWRRIQRKKLVVKKIGLEKTQKVRQSVTQLKPRTNTGKSASPKHIQRSVNVKPIPHSELKLPPLSKPKIE